LAISAGIGAAASSFCLERKKPTRKDNTSWRQFKKQPSSKPGCSGSVCSLAKPEVWWQVSKTSGSESGGNSKASGEPFCPGGEKAWLIDQKLCLPVAN